MRAATCVRRHVVRMRDVSQLLYRRNIQVTCESDEGSLMKGSDLSSEPLPLAPALWAAGAARARWEIILLRGMNAAAHPSCPGFLRLSAESRTAGMSRKPR